MMVLNEKCDICGQRLTDASGHWTVTHTDHGINKQGSIRMRLCGYCNEESLKLLSELKKKKKAKEA